MLLCWESLSWKARSSKESEEIFFSLKLVFIRQEVRNLAGTKFPLSRNFRCFLDGIDFYFSFAAILLILKCRLFLIAHRFFLYSFW